MKAQLSMGVNEKNVVREAKVLQEDILEIITWYQAQIFVKMTRALNGRIDEEDFEDDNDFQRDSDGSAKVALIGIDRSIAAWGKLQQLFPEKTDDFITFLLHLDRLRKQIELEFPSARSFKRPGFDDE